MVSEQLVLKESKNKAVRRVDLPLGELAQFITDTWHQQNVCLTILCGTAAMTPLERPICCLCDEPAVVCECPGLLSGQEVVIPLVFRSEPSKSQEGLDLFATYLERHPATRSINIRKFVSDCAKNMQAVEQVATAHVQAKSGHPY